MKIGKQADALLHPAQAGVRAIAGHSAGAPVEKTAGVDAVKLSSTSRGLAAENAGGSMPVRAEKVEEVRSAIEEGRFQVDANVVAEKMIAQAAELLETLSRK